MKKLFTTALLALAFCFSQTAEAKVEHLLPKPQKITHNDGNSFALNRKIAINDPTQSTLLAKFFTDNKCTISNDGIPVTVNIVQSIEGAYDYELAGYENEAYTLEITADAINITAIAPTGVIRAAQTLAQLAEGYEGNAELEAVSITDWPAFKLRGYMHDVGRSFIKIETLKKHIDLLSRFKVNTFHWHMTENQAWRFEVKKYPQLTSESSMTRFAGKFYTQEQCKDLQDYAKERGVIVIPEIDMPGHSEAFKRAMGHDMQTDQGVEELKYILEEVAATFPDAPYIHIGADEKDITYTDFLKIITDKVHNMNKKVIVWNPIRNIGITTSTGADMTQMWSSSGKVINGLPNIDCRYNYTNHFDVFADLVGIYKSNIYYTDKGNANVAGTISAPWNDRKTPTEEDIIIQNNFYANVIASAERAWIGGGKQYIEKGGTTLPNSGEEYEEFADWERRFLFHKANSLKEEPIAYVKQTNVRWHITDPFPNGGNMNAAFAPENDGLNPDAEMAESYEHDGKTYYTGMATGAGIYLRHTWGNNTVPTYYGNTNHSNMTAYAWTYVYSKEEQTVGAQIEFQNYGRSEKDAAPDAGKWDRKGSDIWLNGTRINPPVWDNSGKGIDNEKDLLNENFTARKPIEVKLKQGWNKVFIKLPYVGANNVRLNKWMFTFVLTDLNGKNAVEGLIYSPNKSMDIAADLLSTTISEAKRYIADVTGDAPGKFNPELAAGLNAVIAGIEATYGNAMSDEERKKQQKDLNDAFDSFKASLATATANLPKTSNGSTSYYYALSTPQRDNRYAASNGANAEMTGNANITNASTWKFVARNDGKWDIVNRADGTYVSPASNNNTALKTQSASPANGWELKPAATKGMFIIISGTAQFNQTKSELSYKVYNWGNGSNTDDAGCQYLIEEVEIVDNEGGEEVTPPSGEDMISVKILASKGEFTESNPNKSWHAKWVSNETPGFSFATSANNMTTIDDNIAGYSGLTESSTYTITAPEGYVITNIQFNYVNTDTGTHTLNLAINGKRFICSSTPNSLNETIADPQRTFTFVQSGVNKGITFSNFVVTIKNINSTDIEGIVSAKEAKEFYDLQGRRIEQITAPGIYIIDGKKLVVK